MFYVYRGDEEWMKDEIKRIKEQITDRGRKKEAMKQVEGRVDGNK